MTYIPTTLVITQITSCALAIRSVYHNFEGEIRGKLRIVYCEVYFCTKESPREITKFPKKRATVIKCIMTRVPYPNALMSHERTVVARPIQSTRRPTTQVPAITETTYC